MTRRWIVYGLYEGGALQYVGMTAHPKARESGHRKNTAWARRCFMRVLRRASSRGEAERIERRIIQRLQPPRNLRHNPGRHASPAATGDEARKAWHGHPVLTDWAVLEYMPGWSAGRAKKAFGPRERVFLDY